jgi:hypothetical protein
MSNIGQKRLESVFAITRYVIGGATAAAVPTGGTIPKQLLLTTTDILMYANIWKIYFEEDLTGKQLLEIMTELGFVTVVAAGASYVANKSTTAIIGELTQWTGPLGWGPTAAITGSLSGLFGAAWALYCDNLYERKLNQSR